MGKKKRQFIDKKKAQKFTLVHRSQRDPLQADEESAQRVLVPVGSEASYNESGPSQQLENIEENHKYGIYFDDDYNYMQHLKERGEGVLYLSDPLPGQLTSKKFGNIRLPSEVLPSQYEEDEGMLNKGVLPRGPQPDWDPDIVAALDDDIDFDDPENFLEDDFIQMANSESSKKEEYFEKGQNFDSNDEEGWETDSNVSSDIGSNDLGSDDESNTSFDETKSRFTNYSMTSSVIRRTEGLKLLDDKFDKIMEEYDEENLGSIEKEDVNGAFNVNSDLVEQVIEDYIETQKLHDLSETKVSDREGKLSDIEGENSDDEDDEEIFAQFERKTQNEWDCESVISTYSNIYNHPKLIQEEQNQKQKNKQKIEINTKTGLPVGIFIEKKDKESKSELENIDTINLNNTRNKNETAEEKKARKKEVKQIRKSRREEKKNNKLVFKNEYKKQEKMNRNTAVQQGIKMQ